MEDLKLSVLGTVWDEDDDCKHDDVGDGSNVFGHKVNSSQDKSHGVNH